MQEINHSTRHLRDSLNEARQAALWIGATFIGRKGKQLQVESTLQLLQVLVCAPLVMSICGCGISYKTCKGDGWADSSRVSSETGLDSMSPALVCFCQGLAPKYQRLPKAIHCSCFRAAGKKLSLKVTAGCG